jgi:hypothetical protein
LAINIGETYLIHLFGGILKRILSLIFKSIAATIFTLIVLTAIPFILLWMGVLNHSEFEGFGMILMLLILAAGIPTIAILFFIMLFIFSIKTSKKPKR